MMAVRRITLLILLAVLASIGVGNYSADASWRGSTVKIFVDTDIGVDDATAVAWLLQAREANLLGFTTVAGNTTVENATQNLLTLLDTARRQVPVTMGAAEPLEFPRSRMGALSHGPSGLWFSQVTHDLSGIPTDAPAAIAAAARANRGMTLLTLGPLTNVAQAIQRFPQDMSRVRIITLVGSLGPGNRTPVAEFNAFADPQALDIVVESGLDVTLVTLDAFADLKVDSERFPRKLEQRGGAMGDLLAAALTPYFQAETQGAGGDATLPDVAAAMYALRPELGKAMPGLVDIATDGGLTRGQTVMALDLNARVTMITDDEEISELADRAFSDPNFDINAALFEILSRRPDNAKIVLTIKGETMARQLEEDLTRR
jgi:inosine-uridine nucleoside N-ribohydrolase